MMGKYILIFVSVTGFFLNVIKADIINENCITHPSVTGILNCGAKKLLNVIDLATNINSIEILPGLSILSNGFSSRTPKVFSDKFDLSIGSHNKFNQLLINATKRFITGKSLQFKLTNSSGEVVARAMEEGRGIIKLLIGRWLIVLGALVFIVLSTVLGNLSLYSMKSLLVGKLAVVLSSILFIQHFFLKKPEVSATMYEYEYTRPSHVMMSHPYGVGWNSIDNFNQRRVDHPRAQ